MDQVGLDTVENIEEHYVKERGISRSHLDWLHDHYITPGKLGNKTEGKGGLYLVPKPGSQTKILLLNIGLAEPFAANDSLNDMMHRGQILSVDVDTGKATEILGHAYCPDGIGERCLTMFVVAQADPCFRYRLLQQANVLDNYGNLEEQRRCSLLSQSRWQ